MNKKERLYMKFGFAIVLIVAGIFLNYFGIGVNNNLGFGSIGNWMIFVAFLTLILTIISSMKKTERKVDERMTYLSWKAARIAYIAFILSAIVIMIIDAINPIDIPIYMLVNYQVCGFMLIHIISYKYLLKMN